MGGRGRRRASGSAWSTFYKCAHECTERCIRYSSTHSPLKQQRAIVALVVRVASAAVLREGPCGELAPIAPAYHRPPSGGGAGTPFCRIRGAAQPPQPPECHVRGLTEVWVGSVLREGPCGELAPSAPAYHRPPSGGGAGTPFCRIRGAARPPQPPNCHVRGPGQHASTTILAPAAACRRTRILAGHSQRAGNATAATCTRRFLQVSVRPVLSVYPQSHLQFTCNSKSSKCNIKLYNMIKCSAKSLVPTWHTLLGMRRIQNNFFERQLWPGLVTCTLLARYLPLLAVARRCSCSYPQGCMACE